MYKVILNPRYRIVWVKENSKGKKVYRIRLCEDEASDDHGKRLGQEDQD